VARYSRRSSYAALHPEDDRAQLAYALIRDKLRYRHGCALQLARLSTSGRSEGADRYRHLH
jgi:hypothetical protein